MPSNVILLLFYQERVFKLDYFSAAVGKAESVSCLLELGADLRQRCSKGFSALQVAALNVSSPKSTK